MNNLDFSPFGERITNFENQYCHISWDAELEAVILFDKGVFRRGYEVQLIMNKIIEALVLNKSKKLLSNLLKLKVLEQPDQDWIANVWYPHLVRLGVKCNPMIMPESAITRMGLRSRDPLMNNSGVERRYFSKVEEAEEWLRTYDMS